MLRGRMPVLEERPWTKYPTARTPAGKLFGELMMNRGLSILTATSSYWGVPSPPSARASAYFFINLTPIAFALYL